MKNVLSEIYCGLSKIGERTEQLELSEQEISAIYDLEDEIESEMSEELKEKFREFMCLHGKKAAIEEEKSFIRGFRTAMGIMLDAMEHRQTKEDE